MAVNAAAGTAAALAIGVYADLAANLYSATNSSPQTTELFAGDRSETLWKYVKFGHGFALAFGVLGSVLMRKWYPLIGVLIVGVVMHGMYSHALKAGADQAPPANGTDLRAPGGTTTPNTGGIGRGSAKLS